MKFNGLILLALLFVLTNCKTEIIEVNETITHKTNPKLAYFGYTLVDVFWDDPTDATDKTNYIDEVADFSNIADLLIIAPTDDIRDRLNVMESYQVKGILHLHELFFELVGTTDELSGADYDLRSDYMERWDTFVSINEFDSNTSNLATFYLGEEPTWNSISAAEFKLASDYIKATVPEVPILLVEAYPAINLLEIPASVDWVGFDHYFIMDPQTNETFQAELAAIKAKKLNHQDLVLIMDAHYLPFAHGFYGIEIDDMDEIARNYYELANAEEDVAALIAYHWPSGFDFEESIGSRGLPAHVLDEHRAIGKAITGK